jgi:chitin synthase
MTSRRPIYIYWLGVYLLALPIWNFVLPAYAFWHFDDFSWGQTRQVAGEKKGAGHGDSDGDQSAINTVLFQKWAVWEGQGRQKMIEEAA